MTYRLLAVLWLLPACGIGESITLGSPSAESSEDAATPAGGSGGVAAADAPPLDGSAGMPAQDAAADANDPGDAMTDPDAAVNAQCFPLRSPNDIVTCTRAPSSLALGLRTHFTWPLGELEEPFNIEPSVNTIPLVANFNDDNNDGVVDACDVPDVLVTAHDVNGNGMLILLSGDTGAVLLRYLQPVAANVTPALGDLDADGTIEVVTLAPDGQLLVLDHLGHVELFGELSSLLVDQPESCHALAIHDLEGDGAPEILAGYDAFDQYGGRTVSASDEGPIGFLVLEHAICTAPTAADLDADGLMEIIFAPGIIQRTDGAVIAQSSNDGNAFIASFEGDALPELLIPDSNGFTLVHNDFSPTVLLTSAPCVPAAVALADFAGLGAIEVASSACGLRVLSVRGGALLPVWETQEGARSDGLVTAFDLLGRGRADVLHATGSGFFVHAGDTGAVLLQSDELLSSSSFGGPVVADVDNDGSADILLITDDGVRRQLVVLSSPSRSFAPARRIYSQYGNQVTHIDENGALTARPVPFGASHRNAQIELGRTCTPRAL